MKINAISVSTYLKSTKPNLSKNKHIKLNPIPYDTFQISFQNKSKRNVPLNINPEIGYKVANKLEKGTSGFRAPYKSEIFTQKTIKLITLATSEYLKEKTPKGNKPAIIIGGDTRKSSRELIPQIKDTLLSQGVDVIYIKNPTPTPLIAATSKKFGTPVSILMTASHNPWNDGGINFITPNGAIAPSEVTEQIAKNIKTLIKKGEYEEKIKPSGTLYEFNPYDLYKKELQSLDLIDFEEIKKANLKIFYDSLKGTGHYVLPKILKDNGINFEEIKSSGQIGPEPKEENLKELSKQVVNSSGKLKIGISNDGDADRFGIIDENGKYINPSDVLLLVAYHLIKNKQLSGAIIKNHASSILINKLAEKHNLKIQETPVGFKYLASEILNLRKNGEDILVAGEESGGLTVKGHIPEKDGIIANLLILDLIAKENKPISIILKDIKKEFDIKTSIESYSKRFENEEEKEKIMDRWKDYFLKNVILNSKNVQFSKKHILDHKKTKDRFENIAKYKPEGDGYCFVMTDNSTVLIRKSGTEPLIRYRIEATGNNEEEAKQNALLLKNYTDSFI